MDAKKVLEVLREIEHEYGLNDRLLTSLIAELEQQPDKLAWVRKAQAEPGGWRPGTEPPSHENEVNMAFYGCYPNEGLKVTMGYYDLEDKKWFDHWDRPFPDVKWWHDLPPLPEEKP